MTAPRIRVGALRRAGRWSLNLLVLAVMVAAAAWIVPSFFGFSRYVITSGSMTGTYDVGSVVFDKQVPVADLKVGDVITYQPPADAGVPHLVTHRIVRIQPARGGGQLFTTKGDANQSPDPWHFELTGSEQPVVRFAVPRVGWAFIALADRQTRMLLIGAPAALVALFALGELVGAVRSGRGRPRATESAPVAGIPSGPAPVDATELAPARVPLQRGAADAVEAIRA